MSSILEKEVKSLSTCLELQKQDHPNKIQGE